jgi:type IV secretion system protein VirB10
LGKYRSTPIIGNRLAVIWDRIITPTGIDVNMSSPGIDDLGSSGNPGYLDSHWGAASVRRTADQHAQRWVLV